LSEEEKDAHGCLVATEVWDEESQKCVPKPSPNAIVTLTMDEAFATIKMQKAAIDEKDLLIRDLTHQLGEANSVLEAREKAEDIAWILPRSSLNQPELEALPLAEVKRIKNTLAFALPPKKNSVAFGALADLSDREKGLTVGDMSWERTHKRKGGS
jgi:hypothetical protein